VPEVRVVLDDGTQLGILTRDEALRLAEEKGLDLVEIAARSNPPVCRIMDYGRFKYEQSKKQKQARKHAASMELKEIKFRPKTEQHDMDFKISHVRRFLEEGNKCRLVIVFRGREITHPEKGVQVLNRVVEATNDISSVEVRPSLEGKRMLMILGPKAGIVRRAKAVSPAVAPGAAPAHAAPPGQGDEAPNPPPEQVD
jgi:translation initiation factor IF-3